MMPSCAVRAYAALVQEGILAPVARLDRWLDGVLLVLLVTCSVRYLLRHDLDVTAVLVLGGALGLGAAYSTRRLVADRRRRSVAGRLTDDAIRRGGRFEIEERTVPGPPGAPDVCVTCTPGARDWIAWSTDVTGISRIASPLMLATEPVRSLFRTEP